MSTALIQQYCAAQCCENMLQLGVGLIAVRCEGYTETLDFSRHINSTAQL